MSNKDGFSSHIEPAKRLQMRFIALLTAVGYFAYSFVDEIILTPQSAEFLVPFHRFVVPGMLIMTALLTLYVSNFKWATRSLMVTPIIAGAMNNYFVLSAQENPIYLAEVYIGILWLYAYSGLSIKQASICVFTFYCIAMLMHLYMPFPAEILYFHIFWCFFATAFGLMIANLIEHQNKLIFKTNQELSLAAYRDKLTGVYNRKKLEEFTRSEIKRCTRFKHTFSFVLLDIDHFKKVNDEFGHSVGDTVLIEFVAIINQHIRGTDLLVRWGGEEFVIICVESAKQDTLHLLQRLKDTVENHRFTKVGNKTLSMGLTQYNDGDNLESLIKRADLALYEAKANGRNSIAQQ